MLQHNAKPLLQQWRAVARVRCILHQKARSQEEMSMLRLLKLWRRACLRCCEAAQHTRKLMSAVAPFTSRKTRVLEVWRSQTAAGAATRAVLR